MADDRQDTLFPLDLFCEPLDVHVRRIISKLSASRDMARETTKPATSAPTDDASFENQPVPHPHAQLAGLKQLYGPDRVEPRATQHEFRGRYPRPRGLPARRRE